MTYTTRQHLQFGDTPHGEARPYMAGWFKNAEFLTMMNMIGLPQASVIECFITSNLGGATQCEDRLPNDGWVMVCDDDRMALLEYGSVMFHMHADRGGAAFYLPVNDERFMLDIGDDEVLERVPPFGLGMADRYGWVERARMRCKADEVMGVQAP